MCDDDVQWLFIMNIAATNDAERVSLADVRLYIKSDVVSRVGALNGTYIMQISLQTGKKLFNLAG